MRLSQVRYCSICHVLFTEISIIRLNYILFSYRTVNNNLFFVFWNSVIRTMKNNFTQYGPCTERDTSISKKNDIFYKYRLYVNIEKKNMLYFSGEK